MAPAPTLPTVAVLSRTVTPAVELRSESGFYQLETQPGSLKLSQQIASLVWSAGSQPKAIIDGVTQTPSWSTGSALTGVTESSATAVRIGDGMHSIPAFARIGKVMVSYRADSEAWLKAQGNSLHRYGAS